MSQKCFCTIVLLTLLYFRSEYFYPGEIFMHVCELVLSLFLLLLLL